MADLKALIRVKKYQIDEKQKRIADLFRQAEDIEGRKDALRSTLEEERKIAENTILRDTENMFGLYAEGVKKQITLLDRDLAKLETRIQIAQDEIREAFTEMKRIELIQKQRENREAAKITARENAELDEIGLDVFRRNSET